MRKNKQYIDYRYCIFPALTKDIYRLMRKCKRKEAILDRQDKVLKHYDTVAIQKELNIIFS